MAEKRILNVFDRDCDDERDNKRRRTVPSFATVIKEAMMARSVQNFLGMIEPMLRGVVREEVEKGLVQKVMPLQRSPSKKIQAAEPSSTLQLEFTKSLSLPIFTGSKMEDMKGNPLQITLVDTSGGNSHLLLALPPSIKIELVVVDGDFPSDGGEDWTSEEFSRSVLKERAGRRPLLTGDVSVTMRDGVAEAGDLTITDNSSWIRGRRFRIGARVASGSCGGIRIKEALTEPFAVKDHRGELYKKHYPPALNDDVWRLEKIGKDGAFNVRLAGEGINKVQNFLMLSVVHPHRLRGILGAGMSDKMWEVTLGHARTCDLGKKLYLHRRPQGTVLLNPICEVVDAVLDGIHYPPAVLTPSQKEQLALDAYRHWNTLEEVDEVMGNSTLLQPALMLEGVAAAQTAAPQDGLILSNYQTNEFEFNVFGSFPENVQVNLGGWIQTPPLQGLANVNSVSDQSSSDDDQSSLSQPFFFNMA